MLVEPDRFDPAPRMSAETSVRRRRDMRGIRSMGGVSRYRPPPSGAVAEMMAKDREEAPLGGFAGEMATPAREPEIPAPPPIRIPSPPWSEHYAEAEADPRRRAPHEQHDHRPVLNALGLARSYYLVPGRDRPELRSRSWRRRLLLRARPRPGETRYLRRDRLPARHGNEHARGDQSRADGDQVPGRGRAAGGAVAVFEFDVPAGARSPPRTATTSTTRRSTASRAS